MPVSRILSHVIMAPGIVVHEFAHKLACDLTGVEVTDVSYFRLGDPPGYVRHEDPATYRTAFLISVAPFVVNTLFALALFASGLLLFESIAPLEAEVATLEAFAAAEPVTQAGIAVLGWLGLSVGMQAFPSTGDANTLWSRTRRDLRAAPLVLAGLPVVFLIYLVNLLSWAYAHLFYALGLAAGAFWLLGAV